MQARLCAGARFGGLPASAAFGDRFTSAAAANPFFVNQWGPTRFNAAAMPYGDKDCGPTTSVMILSALGLLERPNPRNAERLICEVRDAERGTPTSYSGPTYKPMLIRGLEAYGASTQDLGTDLSSIDEALERGSLVAIAGNPKDAWGLIADRNGNYLVHYAPGHTFDHWCAIFGRTPAGLYLVGDPLNKNGVQPRTREQVETYFETANLGGVAIEVRRA